VAAVNREVHLERYNVLIKEAAGKIKSAKMLL
jgi:hypothetical protein